MSFWLGPLLLLAAGCLDAPPGTGGDEPPDACGTLRVLSDDFDADSGLWTAYGSTALEAGRMQLYAAPDGTSGLETAWSYQLSGGELTVQFRSIGIADGQLVLHLFNQAGDLVGLELAGDILSLVQEVGGQRTAPAAAPYDPSMTWWRIAEADGTLTWWTASDGTDWTERGSLPVEVAGPVTAVVELSAGASQAAVDIESFTPSADEELCPAATLVDDFDAASSRWFATDTAGCSLEVGGLLPEIACANDGSGPVLLAQVYGDADAPGELAAVDFDPELHRLWRIRHDEGQGELAFEVASAAGDWRALAVTPIAEPAVRSVGAGVSITDDAADGDPGPVTLDRLNLVPEGSS